MDTWPADARAFSRPSHLQGKSPGNEVDAELKDSLREVCEWYPKDDNVAGSYHSPTRSDLTFGRMFNWLNQQVSSFKYHWYGPKLQRQCFQESPNRSLKLKRSHDWLVQWKPGDELSCDGPDAWTESSRRNKRTETSVSNRALLAKIEKISFKKLRSFLTLIS